MSKIKNNQGINDSVMTQAEKFLKNTLGTHNGACRVTVRRRRTGLDEGGQETSCVGTFVWGGFGLQVPGQGDGEVLAPQQGNVSFLPRDPLVGPPSLGDTLPPHTHQVTTHQALGCPQLLGRFFSAVTCPQDCERPGQRLPATLGPGTEQEISTYGLLLAIPKYILPKDERRQTSP